MRLRFLIAALFVMPAASGSVARAAPAGGAGSPLVSFTRQNAFTIPFRIEPPQTPAQQPVEVQLHVSTDSGGSWQLASRVKPEKGAFVFRSPRDGEYWYSIRTVDASGTTRPDGALEPQLKVTVDTVAPRLELSAARGPAGEVVARWQAVDPHLKLSSFKLEYQASASDPWERVTVESPPPAMRHTLTGETTWWPRTTSGPILVRAEVTDEAGNPAVSQTVVKDAARGPGGDNAATGGERLPRATDPPDTGRWQAERSSGDAPSRSSAQPPGDEGRDWRTASSAGGGFSGDARSTAPGDQLSRGGPLGSPLDFSRLPPGQRPRMVNSRMFELEYEIDAVGPSGISKVELWGTRDAGQTWSIFAVDPDNRSPMPVSLEAEGVYGFRVVVQSGNGLGGRTPGEGDLPDIWIGIDLTKPTARLTRAEMAPDGTELIINWEASDDVLDARPIALSFGGGPNGPWTPVAAGLENTGTYRWRLDNRVPERIYLRLEARDEAGNVGSFETAEAVALDRHRPEGRIRGVRPLGAPPHN
jgi:hypothetical protein